MLNYCFKMIDIYINFSNEHKGFVELLDGIGVKKWSLKIYTNPRKIQLVANIFGKIW